MVEKYSQTIPLSNLKGLFRHGCDPHAKSKNMREKMLAFTNWPLTTLILLISTGRPLGTSLKYKGVTIRFTPNCCCHVRTPSTTLGNCPISTGVPAMYTIGIL